MVAGTFGEIGLEDRADAAPVMGQKRPVDKEEVCTSVLLKVWSPDQGAFANTSMIKREKLRHVFGNFHSELTSLVHTSLLFLCVCFHFILQQFIFIVFY